MNGENCGKVTTSWSYNYGKYSGWMVFFYLAYTAKLHSGMLCCKAVIDDFGDLVLTELPW